MLRSLALIAILTSHHFAATQPFNAQNLGVGARYHQLEAGVYQNSTDHLSTYITLARELTRGPLTVGGAIGLFTGYQWPVLPVVFPYVVLGTDRLGVQLSILPTRHPILGVSLRLGVR